MVKVSGVPYDVSLPNYAESEEQEDMIATLEHENKCLRARNERLEKENEDLQNRILKLQGIA